MYKYVTLNGDIYIKVNSPLTIKKTIAMIRRYLCLNVLR